MRVKIVYGNPIRYFIDDKEVSEQEHAARTNSKIDDLLSSSGEMLASHQSKCWPMLSDAMAVHPNQIEKATERNRKHGVNVGYAPDGRAILTDRGARRDLMRLEGLHDRKGGYGD